MTCDVRDVWVSAYCPYVLAIGPNDKKLEDGRSHGKHVR